MDPAFDIDHLTDHRVLRLDTQFVPPKLAPRASRAPKVPARPRPDWRSICTPGVTRTKVRKALQNEFEEILGLPGCLSLFDELRRRTFAVCAGLLPPAPVRKMRNSPGWFSRNEAAMSKVMARQWRTRKAFLAAPGSKPKRVLWKAAQRATLQMCRRFKQHFWTEVGVRLSGLYEKNDLEGFYRGINEAYGAARRVGTSGSFAVGAGALLWDKLKRHRIPVAMELERWVEHFSELLNQPGTASDFQRYLPAERVVDSSLDAPFTWDELLDALKKMKAGRATGSDGLPIEVEKFIFSDEMLQLLLSDFNSALLRGVAKQEWKDAVISILFKKGSPSVCDNYRGLSLINHTGKLLERMLQNRLLPFALRVGLVPRGQFGFLAGVGTADAQGLAAHVADSSSQQGLKTFRAFVDLTKAYNKVDAP